MRIHACLDLFPIYSRDLFPSSVFLPLPFHYYEIQSAGLAGGWGFGAESVGGVGQGGEGDLIQVAEAGADFVQESVASGRVNQCAIDGDVGLHWSWIIAAYERKSAANRTTVDTVDQDRSQIAGCDIDLRAIG